MFFKNIFTLHQQEKSHKEMPGYTVDIKSLHTPFKIAVFCDEMKQR